MIGGKGQGQGQGQGMHSFYLQTVVLNCGFLHDVIQLRCLVSLWFLYKRRAIFPPEFKPNIQGCRKWGDKNCEFGQSMNQADAKESADSSSCSQLPVRFGAIHPWQDLNAFGNFLPSLRQSMGIWFQKIKSIDTFNRSKWSLVKKQGRWYVPQNRVIRHTSLFIAHSLQVHTVFLTKSVQTLDK